MIPITNKQQLRTALHQQRNALSANLKEKYDQAICHKLWQLVQQKNSEVIHCYLPMSNEINITPFIQKLLDHKKTIVTPKTLPHRQLEHLILSRLNAIEKGLYNTTYPTGNTIFLGNYDLIIVPGLAFDNNKNRLGYGGGYYDTFLQQHPTAYKVGLAYPFQVLAEIPVEKHDVVLDEVLVP